MIGSRQAFKKAIGVAAALLGLAGALACTAPASARADESAIVGIVDQARLVKIPTGTDTLIIGNSTVADVTLLKQKGLMVLTPESLRRHQFHRARCRGRPARGIDDSGDQLERCARRPAGHGPSILQLCAELPAGRASGRRRQIPVERRGAGCRPRPAPVRRRRADTAGASCRRTERDGRRFRATAQIV